MPQAARRMPVPTAIALIPMAAARSNGPGLRYVASNRCSMSVHLLFELRHVLLAVGWIIVFRDVSLTGSDKRIDVGRIPDAPSRNKHNVVDQAVHEFFND